MLFHSTQANRHGVNLDRVGNDNHRVSDKDFGIIPFRAIVVAYYSKSQMVDVVYPRDGGTGFLSGVDVYGNHGSLLGTVVNPDLAVEKTDDGYNLDPKPSDTRTEIGEQRNNVECLVQRTVDGFATSEFRALNEANPLWLNGKAGRRISAYSDGSYYIQDNDGNSEFVHCSGFKITIGSSINLEDPMPINKTNAANTAISYIVEHPLLSAKMGLDTSGKLIAENSSGKVGVKIGAIIDEINKIIVAQGTGPDTGALNTLKAEILEILG